jgi:hypothetical protein
MTVWLHGVRSGRSPPHVKAVSTTIDFGTLGALSRPSMARSASAWPTS